VTLLSLLDDIYPWLPHVARLRAARCGGCHGFSRFPTLPLLAPFASERNRLYRNEVVYPTSSPSCPQTPSLLEQTQQLLPKCVPTCSVSARQ